MGALTTNHTPTNSHEEHCSGLPRTILGQRWERLDARLHCRATTPRLPRAHPPPTKKGATTGN
eukprot:9538740-Prorocentrum_lima.AAC.1